jgi:hypothetical protein
MSLSHTLIPRLLLLTAAFALCLISSPNALAQGLSERQVTNFVDSMENLIPLLEKHEDYIRSIETKRDPADMDFSSMFSTGLTETRGHPFYSDLNDLAKRHGFANMDQWAATGDRVFQAVMALEMDQQPPGQLEEMQAMLAGLENNPQIDAAQKARMRTMVESSLNMMESVKDVPASDKALVRPYKDRLQAIMGGE